MTDHATFIARHILPREGNPIVSPERGWCRYLDADRNICWHMWVNCPEKEETLHISVTQVMMFDGQDRWRFAQGVRETRKRLALALAEHRLY